MNTPESFDPDPFSKELIDKKNKQKMADRRRQRMLDAVTAGTVLNHLIETSQPDKNLQESWKQFQQTHPHFFDSQPEVKTITSRCITRLENSGYETAEQMASFDSQKISTKEESPQMRAAIIGAVFDQWPEEILDQIPSLITELGTKLQSSD